MAWRFYLVVIILISGVSMAGPTEDCFRMIAQGRVRDIDPHVLSQSRLNFQKIDAKGDTIVHAIARTGYARLVPPLVQARADVNARNIHGETPLHVACASGHAQM